MNPKLNRKLDRLHNLNLVGDIVTGVGNYIEFDLYKSALEINNDYTDAKELSDLVSFLTKETVDPSVFINTEDERSNDLIEAFTKLNESYELLENRYNINKETINKIFDLLKNILISPAIYLSIPRNCNYLTLYILGAIDKKELEFNFIQLNITGIHKQMNKKYFYNIYSKVLDTYNFCIKQVILIL